MKHEKKRKFIFIKSFNFKQILDRILYSSIHASIWKWDFFLRHPCIQKCRNHLRIFLVWPRINLKCLTNSHCSRILLWWWACTKVVIFFELMENDYSMNITPVGREKTKCSQLRKVCGRMSWAANIRALMRLIKLVH